MKHKHIGYQCQYQYKIASSGRWIDTMNVGSTYHACRQWMLVLMREEAIHMKVYKLCWSRPSIEDYYVVLDLDEGSWARMKQLRLIWIRRDCQGENVQDNYRIVVANSIDDPDRGRDLYEEYA